MWNPDQVYIVQNHKLS